MHPKFIIVTKPLRTKGFLRMGTAVLHKDLVVGYEKVHGGGWWFRNDEKKEITLYGGSGDYGEPDFRFLNMIPKEFKEYTFYYSSSLDKPGNPLNLSEIEWV